MKKGVNEKDVNWNVKTYIERASTRSGWIDLNEVLNNIDSGVVSPHEVFESLDAYKK